VAETVTGGDHSSKNRRIFHEFVARGSLGPIVMSSLLQDVRYALRVLAHAPMFTAITVLTMAVGIGANVTVFSFVSALLLRPAPGVADPGSLMAIFTSDYSSGPYGDSSYPDYMSLRSETTAFSAMAAEGDDSTAAVRVGDFVERVRVSSVTGDYFQLLGLKPAAGRLIGEDDTRASASPVAVISYSIWMRAFKRSPAVLGSILTLNARKYTIVGIAPEPFTGLDIGRAADVWTPMHPPSSTPDARGNRGIAVVARLAPGATLGSAQAQVSAVAARLAKDYPESNQGILGAPDQPRPMIVLRHTRLPPDFRGTVSSLGAILMGAVGLVLLIACANIASLLLSRATARDREMAIRLALGAGRHRVIRQLLTESLLLGLAGGAFGLLFSLWTADLLPSFFPAEQARLLDTRIDGTALAFVLAVSFLSSILFGLVPALQAAAPATSGALRNGPGRVSDNPTRTMLRRILVCAQVAVAIVLLIGASLLAKSVANAAAADPGFGARDGVVASVELPDGEFTPEQGLLYYREAVERVASLPGVQAASLARTLPTSRPSRRGFRMEGYQPQPGEDSELPVNVVAEDYFETLQIPLLAGRTFHARDRAGSAPVAVVNDLLAKHYYGGDAVGRRITDSAGLVMEIVGVVRTTVGITVQSKTTPMVYYPLSQSYLPRMTLVARTGAEPSGLIEPVRRELLSVNRNVPVFRTITLASHLAEAAADSRLTATLVATCAGMALLLATIGVYGVIAYAVARRTREIGVRLALGARPWHIVHLVMSEGLTVMFVGIACGLLGAVVATQALDSLLYGVTSSDPTTYLLVPIILTLVAVLAAFAPARRALRVEPNAVLRQE
jgi:predicted permease